MDPVSTAIGLVSIIKKLVDRFDQANSTSKHLEFLRNCAVDIARLFEDESKNYDKITIQTCSKLIGEVNEISDEYWKLTNRNNWIYKIYSVVRANYFVSQTILMKEKLSTVHKTLSVAANKTDLEIQREIKAMSISFYEALKKDTQALILLQQKASTAASNDSNIELIDDSKTDEFIRESPNNISASVELQIRSGEKITNELAGNLKEFKEFQQQLQEITKRINPLNYNPDLSILMATSVGLSFNELEVLDIFRAIEEGRNDETVRIFKTKKETLKKDLDKEISDYFKMYVGKKSNLTTLVKGAIHFARESPITLFLDQDNHYFVDRLFVYDRTGQNGKERVVGQIESFTKQDDYLIDLVIKTFEGFRYRIVISSTSSYWDTVTGQYMSGVSLKHSLTLRVKAYQTIEMPLGYFIKAQFARTVSKDGKNSMVWVKRKNRGSFTAMANYEKFFYNDIEQFEVSVEGKNVKFMRASSGDGSAVSISYNVRDHMIMVESLVSGIIFPKTAKEIISFEDFNQQLVAAYPELSFSEENVEPKFVQLKKKLCNPNEMRMKMQKKVNDIISFITSELALPKNQPLVVNVLEKLRYNSTGEIEFENAETFFVSWLGTELKDDILKDKFEQYSKLYNQLFEMQQENDRIKYYGTIINMVLDANCLSFMDTRKHSLPVLEIMSRLTEGLSLLSTVRNKDLVLFVGETGAGKSTSINYFVGAPLVARQIGSFSQYVIDENQIEESTSENNKPKFAKIGHSLVTSMTTYVEGFPLDDETTRYWEHNENYDFEQLRLCDCPGFHDTRGETFDLTAILSTSKALKHASSVKGVVLVLPFRCFISGRGNQAMEAMNMLGDLFQGGIEYLSKNEYLLKQNIYLIISHSSQPLEDNEHFGDLLAQFRMDAAAACDGTTPGMDVDFALYRLKIWEMIEKLFNYGNVLFIDLTDENEKVSFLNKCCARRSYSIPKSMFASPFESSVVKKSFVDAIEGSIYIWQDLILRKYYEEIPKNMDDNTKSIDKLRLQIDVKRNEIRDMNLSIDVKECRIYFLQSELSKLQGMDEWDISNLTPELQEIIQYASQMEEVEYESLVKERDSTIASNEIKKQKILQIQQHDIVNSKQKIAELQKNVQELKTKKERLEKGTVSTVLQEFYYKDRETLRVGTYKATTKVSLYNEMRAVTDDDFEPGTIQTYKPVDYTGSVSSDILLESKFRVVPIEKLDEFYSSKEALTSKGKFIAQLDGEHVTLGQMKASPDGKKVLYGLNMTFTKGKSLPWYKITHTVPSIEVNEVEILSIDSQITTLLARIHAEETGELTRFQKEIKEIEAESHRLVIFVEKMHARIAIYEKERNRKTKLEVETRLSESITSLNEQILDQRRYIAGCESTIESLNLVMTELQESMEQLHSQRKRLSFAILHKCKLIKCLYDFSLEALSGGSDSQVASAVKFRTMYTNTETNSPQGMSFLDQCAKYNTFIGQHFQDILDACTKGIAAPTIQLVAVGKKKNSEEEETRKNIAMSTPVEHTVADWLVKNQWGKVIHFLQQQVSGGGSNEWTMEQEVDATEVNDIIINVDEHIASMTGNFFGLEEIGERKLNCFSLMNSTTFLEQQYGVSIDNQGNFPSLIATELVHNAQRYFDLVNTQQLPSTTTTTIHPLDFTTPVAKVILTAVATVCQVELHIYTNSDEHWKICISPLAKTIASSNVINIGNSIGNYVVLLEPAIEEVVD